MTNTTDIRSHIYPAQDGMSQLIAGTLDLPEVAAQVGITPGICQTTINGWVWYCDPHATHGNADSEAEAKYMARAHLGYFLKLDLEDGDTEAEFGEHCGLYVFEKRERPTD